MNTKKKHIDHVYVINFQLKLETPFLFLNATRETAG